MTKTGSRLHLAWFNVVLVASFHDGITEEETKRLLVDHVPILVKDQLTVVVGWVCCGLRTTSYSIPTFIENN